MFFAEITAVTASRLRVGTVSPLLATAEGINMRNLVTRILYGPLTYVLLIRRYGVKFLINCKKIPPSTKCQERWMLYPFLSSVAAAARSISHAPILPTATHTYPIDTAMSSVGHRCNTSRVHSSSYPVIESGCLAYLTMICCGTVKHF